jgi:hypothetical protein
MPHERGECRQNTEIVLFPRVVVLEVDISTALVVIEALVQYTKFTFFTSI